jgi:hypothetical protein
MGTVVDVPGLRDGVLCRGIWAARASAVHEALSRMLAMSLATVTVLV